MAPTKGRGRPKKAVNEDAAVDEAGKWWWWGGVGIMAPSIVMQKNFLINFFRAFFSL